jgi:hypothetical protein
MKESSPSAAQLSVIVVSFSALPTLQLSLEALAAQIVRLDRPNSALLALRSTSAAAPAASDAAGLGKAPLVEVLVVRAKSKDVMGRMTRAIAELRVQFPWFQWLEVSEGTTVPLMRKHGLERSAGEIIASIGPCFFATMRVTWPLSPVMCRLCQATIYPTSARS